MHISLKFDFFIAINASHSLHQLLILQPSISTINRVVFKSTDASLLHSLQKQNQIMLIHSYLFTTTNPLLYFRSQQITFMITIHQIASILLSISTKKVQQNLFLLQCFLSSCQLNTTISTIFKSLERFVQINSIRCHRLVYCLVDYFPIYILIILLYFYLNSFLSNFIFDSLLSQLVQNRSNCLVQASRYVQQVDFTTNLLYQWKLLLQTSNGIHVNLNLVDSSIVYTHHSIQLQCIHYLTKQTCRYLILTTKRIYSNHFLLIFLRILLADCIALQQLIIDVIGITTFFRLLLSLDWFLHHMHNYPLKIL